MTRSPARSRALIHRSLNAPDSDTDQKWAAVALRRLAELRAGHVRPVPGEDVFRKVWKRFGASCTPKRPTGSPFSL
ncbi:MAG: addiction module protein [Victivallales bacterium]|nr:addiction module protein [Victivallales bacterium]